MPYKDTQKQKEAQHRSYLNNKTVIYENALRDKRKKRLYIQKLKDVPCMDCNQRYPAYVMDFDHREKESKKMNVGELTNYSWKRLLDEIKKCDIICANCHRERTHKNKIIN